MRSSIRALMALLAVMVLAVGLAACGGSDEPTTTSNNADATPTPTAAAGNTAAVEPIKNDPANQGKTFTVGSKNFAEQYILGEIYAQALEAAGFDVKKQLDLGSEQVAFRALKSGRIDAYPEYTGTALTSFYRVKTDDVPRDKDESFTQLQQDLAKDNITAMPQTSFQNTYVITTTKETAAKYGNPKTISDLVAKVGSDVSISGFPECRQRTDCLLGLKQVYNWTPKFISSQGQYTDLDKGQADLTFGFSTDGALSLDKYATFEDDKQLFPPYYVTFMVNQDGMKTLADNGGKVIEAVQKPLTEEVMRELNSRVTLDKQAPKAVAKQYLTEAGFIGS